MEFPQGETELSAGLVSNPLQRDPATGLVHVPNTPGLGVTIDLALVRNPDELRSWGCQGCRSLIRPRHMKSPCGYGWSAWAANASAPRHRLHH